MKVKKAILKRCDVCGRYHASYLVPEGETGARRLCSECWHALYGSRYQAEPPDRAAPAEAPGRAPDGPPDRDA